MEHWNKDKNYMSIPENSVQVWLKTSDDLNTDYIDIKVIWYDGSCILQG